MQKDFLQWRQWYFPSIIFIVYVKIEIYAAAGYTELLALRTQYAALAHNATHRHNIFANFIWMLCQSFKKPIK